MTVFNVTAPSTPLIRTFALRGSMKFLTKKDEVMSFQISGQVRKVYRSSAASLLPDIRRASLLNTLKQTRRRQNCHVSSGDWNPLITSKHICYCNKIHSGLVLCALLGTFTMLTWCLRVDLYWSIGCHLYTEWVSYLGWPLGAMSAAWSYLATVELGIEPWNSAS